MFYLVMFLFPKDKSF